MKAIAQERRKFSRLAAAARFEVSLLSPSAMLAATTVNFSEGGLCLRLREALEVRSLIRFQLTPESSDRSGTLRAGQPVACTGRVAWVIQRLDLRDAPPFLYDVGVEFVDLPSALRGLIAQPDSGSRSADRAHRLHALPPAVIRNRQYVPTFQRTAHPQPWHLVVSVDGNPCFSAHYASEQQVLAGWAKFKRQQTRQRAS